MRSSWPMTARAISARMRSIFSLSANTFTSPSCRGGRQQCCEVTERCQVFCGVRFLEGGVAHQVGGGLVGRPRLDEDAHDVAQRAARARGDLLGDGKDALAARQV